MTSFYDRGNLKIGSRATIYFARRGPYVKIGISRTVARRIRNLRYDACITPADADRTEPVELLGTIPDCSLNDEFQMHCRFEDWHAVGEWFRYDADSAAAVAEVIAEGRMKAAS